MRLRLLLALSTMTTTLVFAGWVAIEFAGWPSRPAAHVEGPLVLTSSITPIELRGAAPVFASTAAETQAQEAPAIFGWDPALFNPKTTMPLQAAPSMADRRDAVPSAQRETPQDTRASTTAVSSARREKSKPDRFDGRLTVAQIANIKRRLKLTPDQEEYWAPIQTMLLDMVKRSQNGGTIAMTPVESQNLYWAAGPLVMRLREDQKQEARNLARAMGLETVAALL